jgi:hypothetical protein
MPEGPGPDHSFRDPHAAKVGYQRVTNEVWPFNDSNGRHARGIDDQPAERQLDVMARLVFEHDGETWVNGRAVRWNRSHVMVVVTDPRLHTGMVWLRAHDVKRR